MLNERIAKQIRQVVELVESGTSVKDACKTVGIHWASYYKFRNQVLVQAPKRKYVRKTPLATALKTESAFKAFVFVGTKSEVIEAVRSLQ